MFVAFYPFYFLYRIQYFYDNINFLSDKSFHPLFLGNLYDKRIGNILKKQKSFFIKVLLYDCIKEEKVLHVKFSKRGQALIVSIVGELDHHSAEYIKSKVDSEIIKSSTKNMIFDFSKVSFMDSSGIGTIIGRYKKIKNLNGKTAIANISPQTKRIIEMSGLLKIIQIYESIDIAVSEM